MQILHHGWIDNNTNNQYKNLIAFANDSEKMQNEMDSAGNLQTYTCTCYISNATGRVYKVIFNRNM